MKKTFFTFAAAIFIYSLPATAAEIDDINEGIAAPRAFTYHASAGHVDVSELSNNELNDRLRQFQQYSNQAYNRYMRFQQAGLVGVGTLLGGIVAQFICTVGIISEEACDADIALYTRLLVPVAGGITLAASLAAVPPLLPSLIVLRASMVRDEGVVNFNRDYGSELKDQLRKRGYIARIFDRIAWQGRTDQGLNLLGIYED